jgi:hypothetical protein
MGDLRRKRAQPRFVIMDGSVRRQLTYRVPLPGGQERLRQLIVYIAKRCREAPYFGAIKLNKILWRADFDSFSQRGVPVTGRAYQRLPLGPAPIDMAPLHAEMRERGYIEVEERDFGGNLVEKRTVALVEPQLNLFSPEDIEFVDRAIAHYWNKTGEEGSEDSHGIAWSVLGDGDAMPYELAHLSDEPLAGTQQARLLERGRHSEWARSR